MFIQGPDKHANIKEYFPEAGFDVLPAVPGRRAAGPPSAIDFRWVSGRFVDDPGCGGYPFMCHFFMCLFGAFGAIDVTKPYESIGFGGIDVTKPYESIRFGSIDVTKPYESIRFGAMEATKPYEFIGLGAMDVTKPYEFLRFKGHGCNQTL